LALALALASAGSSIPARMAMMAMTTSNSMSVKALETKRSIAAKTGTLVFTGEDKTLNVIRCQI
jgi:hypothetical protein